uniref:Uncharacterized protein n=1 Tax=Trichogramma kaykai TaxID=54128 RepID=A0ABD2VTT7_9HYME
MNEHQLQLEIKRLLNKCGPRKIAKLYSRHFNQYEQVTRLFYEVCHQKGFLSIPCMRQLVTKYRQIYGHASTSNYRDIPIFRNGGGANPQRENEAEENVQDGLGAPQADVQEPLFIIEKETEFFSKRYQLNALELQLRVKEPDANTNLIEYVSTAMAAIHEHLVKRAGDKNKRIEEITEEIFYIKKFLLWFDNECFKDKENVCSALNAVIFPQHVLHRLEWKMNNLLIPYSRKNEGLFNPDATEPNIFWGSITQTEAEYYHNKTDELYDLHITDTSDLVQHSYGMDEIVVESMKADKSICFICEEDINKKPNRIIGKKAIETLSKSRKERGKDKNDNKEFKKYSSMAVHISCQTMYNSELSIEASRKKIEKEKAPRTSKSRFNKIFCDEYCLFCEGQVSDEYLKKISVNEYKKISSLKKNESKIKILRALNSILETKLSKKEEKQIKAIKARTETVDLESGVTKYHKDCYVKYVHRYPKKNSAPGRPLKEEHTSAIDFIINHLITNCNDECQFSIQSILDEYGGDKSGYNLKTIVKKIEEQFQDEIIIHPMSNDEDYVICFRNNNSSNLYHDWVDQLKGNSIEKRRKVVEAAGQIILEDIRSKFYDVSYYPALNCFLDKIDDDIPDTLELLLSSILKGGKKDSLKIKKRITTIAHIIISAVRPRSFLSPILLGLSSMLHKKYASKNLIDSLAYLGLCSSYYETLLFQASIVTDPQNYKTNQAFIQLVYDNADHNTCTIDGRNTFHCMGGIICATPASDVTCGKIIQRLKSMPSSTVIGKFGFVELKKFDKKQSSGLSGVTIEEIDQENFLSEDETFSSPDLLWFLSRKRNPYTSEGWNGFMEKFYNSGKPRYETSKIMPLPFVNNPPSNYHTIYTVLTEANKICINKKQANIFVTFDQPLYWKAREILACCEGTEIADSINRVIVRLGGFHMLMSFLGSIGNIMDGSGLLEAFQVLFAECSAAKALTGHAYSRAVRGHILVQNALSNLLLTSIDISSDDEEKIESCFEAVETDEEYLEEFCDLLYDQKKIFWNKLQNLKNNGPTAQLWVQYFEMVQLVKNFIEAERTGY